MATSKALRLSGRLTPIRASGPRRSRMIRGSVGFMIELGSMPDTDVAQPFGSIEQKFKHQRRNTPCSPEVFSGVVPWHFRIECSPRKDVEDTTSRH